MNVSSFHLVSLGQFSFCSQHRPPHGAQSQQRALEGWFQVSGGAGPLQPLSSHVAKLFHVQLQIPNWPDKLSSSLAGYFWVSCSQAPEHPIAAFCFLPHKRK